jgi:hypothetical protein
MRMGFTCWKCGTRATSVKLKTISPTLMEAGYRCVNIDCGHTFVVALEAIRTLNPGAFPSPRGVNVPLSKHVRRRELLSQLDSLPEALGGGMNERPASAQLGLGLEDPAYGPS